MGNTDCQLRAVFARHYSRLVWLLLHETSNVDEQKASLRALVTVSKDGAVTLVSDGADLTANGHDVPGVLSGVRHSRWDTDRRRDH